MTHRLGDIIDDYCPKCCLLTNHSVSALVGKELKQVECRACYHSHAYKGGKAPKKKKKKTTKQSAYDEVLASILRGKTLQTEQVAPVKPASDKSARPRTTGRGKKPHSPRGRAPFSLN